MFNAPPKFFVLNRFGINRFGNSQGENYNYGLGHILHYTNAVSEYVSSGYRWHISFNNNNVVLYDYYDDYHFVNFANGTYTYLCFI